MEVPADDAALWTQWLAAVTQSPVVSDPDETVPISYIKTGENDGKESVESLAICETGDWKIDAAYRYSQAAFGKTIKTPAGETDWDAAIAELERLEDGCLKQIVISGHGNTRKAGSFTLDQLRDNNSSQAKFLKLLKQKAAEGATIELRACQNCSEENHGLIRKIAELTGLKVIGYDDVYAIKPHGQQWIARPDGKGKISVEKGEKLSHYKESWIYQIFEGDKKGKKK